MVTVSIAGIERDVSNADDGWINENISRRLEAGQLVCVEVSIREPEINICLRTPTCVSSSGGGRKPNRLEQQIVDLWTKHRLNTRDFTKHDINSFLSQLKTLV